MTTTFSLSVIDLAAVMNKFGNAPIATQGIVLHTTDEELIDRASHITCVYNHLKFANDSTLYLVNSDPRGWPKYRNIDVTDTLNEMDDLLQGVVDRRANKRYISSNDILHLVEEACTTSSEIEVLERFAIILGAHMDLNESALIHINDITYALNLYENGHTE